MRHRHSETGLTVRTVVRPWNPVVDRRSRFSLWKHSRCRSLDVRIIFEEFRAICELTTEGSAELLDHLPAGGIQCPACRNHQQGGGMPLIFVEAGAVGVLACERHATAVIECYQSGRQTRQQLGANGPHGGGSTHNTAGLELPDLDDS